MPQTSPIIPPPHFVERGLGGGDKGEKYYWLYATAALILAAVLLSACAGTPPVATQPVATVDLQTEVAATVAAVLTGTAIPVTPTRDDRPTLPPTWTPTFTPIPITPNATFTITPTLTPTITQTVSVASICDGLNLVTNLKPGQYFRWRSKITLFMGASAPAGTTVRFVATQHFSKATRTADLPGGQSNILQLPVKSLPETGQYEWTLVVKTPNYGDICEQGGWFIATSQESTRAEESHTR